MHLARLLLGSLALALAGLCALAAVLAQGGRFSPELDVLTHAAPLLVTGALAGGLLAIAALPAQRNLALVVTALGVVAGGTLIVPELLRPIGPTAPAMAPGQIKVIELNAWWGNPHPARIADWLAREDPDFVIVPEASPMLRELILGRTRLRGVAGAMSTLMIFSREPYLKMDRPAVSTSSGLTFVNATFPSPDGPVEMVSTHIDWPTRAIHRGQGPTLASVLARLPRDRMILAGDFNSTPWSFARRRDDAAFGLTRRDRALATWPTGRSGSWRWPAPFPFLPIDHVYAGAGWATVSVRRGPRLGSDHYPIVIMLAPVSPH